MHYNRRTDRPSCLQTDSLKTLHPVPRGINFLRHAC